MFQMCHEQTSSFRLTPGFSWNLTQIKTAWPVIAIFLDIQKAGNPRCAPIFHVSHFFAGPLSQTNNTGRLHKAARFSWNSPSATAPSPKKKETSDDNVVATHLIGQCKPD